MVASTMGSGEQTVDMDKERSNGRVEQHILANSVTIEDMVMEKSSMLTEPNTWASGETTRGMVRENFHG